MESNDNNVASRVKTMTYKKKNGRGTSEPKQQSVLRNRVSECEDEKLCDLCVHPIEIYAIGHCNHPICHRCSAKMRVICKQRECSVCRVTMKMVIYSKVKKLYDTLNESKLIRLGRQPCCFTDETVKKDYLTLFEFSCPKCPGRPPEVSFVKLQKHIRAEHNLHFCDICAKHNTNFASELKLYSRESLGRHRRLGDEGDTSHRGHPLCEFCDERYLNDDSLFKHLRTDHYFCHFCDRNGKNQYYDQYYDLRLHYKSDHYLCEEGDCKEEKFTSVFASELDFKAHCVAEHSEKLTKQQQKAERNIDLGFEYSRPPMRRGRGAGITSDDYADVGRSKGRGRGRGRAEGGKVSKEEQDLEMAKALSLSEQKNGGSGTKKDGPVDRPRLRREEKSKPQPQEEDETPDLERDFPVLGTAEEDHQASLYTYNTVQEKTKTAEPVQRSAPKPNPVQQSAASTVAAAYGRSTGSIKQEDFPTLGSANKSSGGQAIGMWGATTPVGPTNKVQQKKSTPSSVNMPASAFSNRARVNITSKNDFPSLGGGKKTPIAGTVKSIWGQMVPAPTANVSKPKPKKPVAKPPKPQNQPPTAPKMKVVVQSNLVTHDETVNIRFGSGKHGMNLTTAKYSEEISDIEKPVEVPGAGSTSVQTVSRDVYSLLGGAVSKSNNTGGGNFHVADTDFPELGGGAGKDGRIRGIGGSWAREPPNYNKGGKKGGKKKKSGLSLADISNDIFPSSSLDNAYPGTVIDTSVVQGSKNGTGPLQHVKKPDPFTPNSESPNLARKGEPQPTAPRSLASYPANWQEEETMVADWVASKGSFTVQENDFPSLGNEGKKVPNGGKKNKKKKKNKAAQNASEISKHFSSVKLSDDSSESKLEDLLKGKDSKNGLSSVIDYAVQKSEAKEVKRVDGSEKHQVQSYDEEIDVILPARPNSKDMNARNIWLIQSVELLCGTEENFSEFKSCSGKFRKGTMSAEIYYEKCKILLGKRHFTLVFSELVDLLPDEEKKDELRQIHLGTM